MRHAIIASVLAVVLGTTLGTPALAIKTSTFVGRVVHISADNIKVQNASGQTMSFLIVPRFNGLSTKDGKPAQMNTLHTGMPVTVVYDQKALGIRHADRIMINGSIRSIKS